MKHEFVSKPRRGRSKPKTARATTRRSRARKPEIGRIHTPFQFTSPVTIDARPGQTIREIADQQGFHLPFIALLNGKAILRAAWDYALKATDRLLFVTLPAGDSVKDVMRLVLQIAVTVTASALLGPAGLGLSGWALAAGVAATTIAGSYLINALLPPTQASIGSLTSDAASPTYSLNAQGNQARLGGQIPKLYGRHIITPDLAAQPYTEYAGNDLYLYQLFSLGLGRIDVEKINIAKTEAWNKVDGYSDSFSDIEFEVVAPGADITLFPINVVTSAEVSGQTLEGPNNDGDWIGPFVSCAPGKQANYLAFDMVFPSGAGRVKDDGSIGSEEAEVRIEVREIDDLGAPIGDWVLLEDATHSFATRTAQRLSRRFPVDLGRHEARVKRVNDTPTSTRRWSEVHWDALRAYLVGDNTAKCMVLAMRALATNQLSSQASRLITVVGTSMLPTWTGTEWSAPTATRDIFPIVADILRNTTYGAGRPDSRIDIEKLASLHETWTTRGDTFDGVFDQTQSVWDVMTDVLMVGRARPIEVGDTVTFVRDEPVTTPKMLITPREIVGDGFKVDYDLFNPSTPDDVLIEYVDERTWDMTATVRCTLPGSTSTNPTRKAIKGIVDRTRAWKYGVYLAAVNRYRREYPTVPVEFDGRILKPMDLIALAHPLCDYGRAGDVLAFDAEAGTLKLSQSAALSTTETNFVRLRKRDGSLWGPITVTAGETPYHVVMDAHELAAMITAQGDPADFIVTPDSAAELLDDMEPTVAVLGHGDNYEADCKLIGARYEGNDRMSLSLVVDNAAVYTADAGDPPAEEAPVRLPTTPAGPTISALDVVVGGTRFAPELTSSIRQAPGAETYLWELSYDHLSWTLLQNGLTTTWAGPVEATTVWLRVTAVGAVRGEPIEWFENLTATDAPPEALSGLSYDAFAQHAWLKFTYPTEAGVEGIIAKTSATSGFDPETTGTIQYDGEPTSRVLLDLGETGTIYARIAAYNVFGKTGLNWSSEIELTSRAIGSGALSPDLRAAFENASVLPDGVVYRLDAGGNIAGFAVISDGVLNEVTAAFLVDTFTIRLPGGDTAPLFETSVDGVKISNLFVTALTAETLKVVWAEVDVLRGGQLLPPTGDAMEINMNDGFIRIDKVVP